MVSPYAGMTEALYAIQITPSETTPTAPSTYTQRMDVITVANAAERSPRANAIESWLNLRGRTPLRGQGDVGERRVGRGPMPMLLLRGDVHHIAGGDDLLFRFRRDDALARGHEQDLIAAVRVHLVPGTRA